MFTWIIANLLWTEGAFILKIILLLLVFSLFVWRNTVYFAVGIFLFSFYFFRNPDRVCAAVIDTNEIILCPADGKIIDVQYDSNKEFEGFAYKIAIFLSPFDVHVNWIPFAGLIKEVTYTPGTFSFAFLPKSSQLNERNDITIENEKGLIMVRQIAGTIARRICCWVRSHEKVDQGQKYGMIRFGSRVEIFLPEQAKINVSIGQQVYGGQTVMATWRNKLKFG